MTLNAGQPFDNVAFRLKNRGCVVSTVAPPFRTAYWPDLEQVVSELELTDGTINKLLEKSMQSQFLLALSKRIKEGKLFQPRSIGFRSLPKDIICRESHRNRQRWVTFIGDCPAEVLFKALEVIAHPMAGRGAIHIRTVGWDPLDDWSAGQRRIMDMMAFLHRSINCTAFLTFFTPLTKLADNLWDFVYEWPRVRVGWIATDLVTCRTSEEMETLKCECVALKHLETLGNGGLYPHIILPVSALNIGRLPDLTQLLTHVSRGATIELIPTPFLRSEVEHPPPDADGYTAVLIEIYRNPDIPLHQISPLSWVVSRMDSTETQPYSPLAAGAEFAVLPNGDLCVGETTVGMEIGYLGNVLDETRPLRWERLDAMPEMFSNTTKPPECHACDWRYRCGGVDCSVNLLIDHGPKRTEQEKRHLFDLYCAPRRALFEEMLWGSVEAAAKTANHRDRETIDLHDDGLSYKSIQKGVERA